MAIIHFLMFFSLASISSLGNNAGTCMDDIAGPTNCSAKDVKIANLAVISGPSTCFLGSSISVQLQAQTICSSQTRYDVGYWIAQDGGNALTGQCYNDYLPTPLSTSLAPNCSSNSDRCSPFLDANGDSCGDIQQGVTNLRNIGGATVASGPQGPPAFITITCADSDASGIADVNVCTSWHNNGHYNTCSNAQETIPENKAKCFCEPVQVGSIISMGCTANNQCNDNDKCTVDTCDNGTCVYTPMTCMPLDACHLAGVCDPTTGLCSNPTAPNNTQCGTFMNCTAFLCENGMCVGISTCPPGEICTGFACEHVSTCTTASNCPAINCFTAACVGGNCAYTPITCTALDQCHAAGTCNPTTGICSNPNAPDGTPCNNNDCTNPDTCQNGVCTSGGSSCGPGQSCIDNQCCGTITMSPSTLPNGIVGDFYSQTITASGGTGPYMFAVSTGSLPPGLSLDPSTGVISGTPTENDTFDFTITATDVNGCTGDASFTINVTSCTVISLSPLTLPDGTAGVAYTQMISAFGGTSPYTFALSEGALPPGLSLDSSTGVISGTPTQAGTFSFTITATDANGCPGQASYAINIVCPTITLSPPTLPGGIAGVFYSQTILAAGGASPYTFALSAGALPPGLLLNSATGVISGTPTQAGTFSFTITATDADGCTGQASYAINIVCPTITLSPSTLPGATLGVFYSQTILATGGASPYTFSLLSGSLPPGLSLNPSTGVISGTPTQVGVFSFSIMATDADGCSGQASFEIGVGCPTITLSPSTLPGGDEGVFYTQTILAFGGTAPYTFSLLAGSLPPGLSLDSSTGVISGIPTETGGFSFSIGVTDAEECGGQASYEIGIGCPTITLSPSTLPTAIVGVFYTQMISASGGMEPYTFVLSSGSLPPGLSLNSSTGVISGIPTQTGTFRFNVTVTDADDCPGLASYEIDVECPTITLSPSTLRAGVVGVFYLQTITASGGTGPYTFFLSSGSLPPGLVLNLFTGTISGTPTQSGAFSFTIMVTDANGCADPGTFVINVICSTVDFITTCLADGHCGEFYSQRIVVSGSLPFTFAIISGSLPPGLSLSPTTGVIEGTITTSGVYHFTVLVRSACGSSAKKRFTIKTCQYATDFGLNP